MLVPHSRRPGFNAQLRFLNPLPAVADPGEAGEGQVVGFLLPTTCMEFLVLGFGPSWGLFQGNEQ